MSSKDILIVEDEPAIREMIAFSLPAEEFTLREAADAGEAEARLCERLPDLILLDWMLPGTSGMEFARRLRRDEYSRHVPIIMLTARAEEDDRITGLEAGADDYVTKPFSPRELIARIHAVLRRASPDRDSDRIESGGLTLDIAGHRLLYGQRQIDLGPTEFRLLRHFMSHPDRVYSRGQLLDAVWGRGAYVEERTVDVHILRLRKALATVNRDGLVQTVRGAGYRFSAQTD
ncbi:MAG: phosphate regulon transcriptional regulatory protein PhoB [Gammaproteobacteria bacterium]|nr:MAG: phosphate regulon transcriptional regulatory protein PhoB [Gammaproteobacteria bacterium]